jgi:hypothetical protein
MQSPVYPRLSANDQHKVLARILERCAPADGQRPVIVFDLDGTLMDNRPRTALILRELGDAWAPTYPALTAKLRAVTSADLAYLIGDSLVKLNIAERDTAMYGEAEGFWKARFFTDEYLKHDIALAGAAKFAHTCYERGANLVYFTGRDLPKMSLGSFQSLRDLGFPIGVPGTELVLKPDFDTPDELYKRTWGPRLGRAGKVVAVFDNEPANCNNLLHIYEGCDSVFIDTQHYPGAPALDPKVHILGDFVMA